MCWTCHIREQSIYRACDGCGNATSPENLHKYDILKEWGQIAEWIEYEKRILMLCANCKDAMDAYRESTRAHVKETEPSGWTIPENGLPVLRYFDKSNGAIPVGIHCIASQQTLGIRCAQAVHGVNATEEILRGFIYHDDEGHQIRRLTLGDVDETIRCDKCWLALWECNAREVSR